MPYVHARVRAGDIAINDFDETVVPLSIVIMGDALTPAETTSASFTMSGPLTQAGFDSQIQTAAMNAIAAMGITLSADRLILPGLRVGA